VRLAVLAVETAVDLTLAAFRNYYLDKSDFNQSVLGRAVFVVKSAVDPGAEVSRLSYLG
jgi:hypothetical protein